MPELPDWSHVHKHFYKYLLDATQHNNVKIPLERQLDQPHSLIPYSFCAFPFQRAKMYLACDIVLSRVHPFSMVV